jgi:transposase
VALRPGDLMQWATSFKPTVIAIEAGTHSPWVSRLLTTAGHEVIVANPVKVALITQNSKKSDGTDAETLARLARVDRALLFPIQHRGEQAQVDLQVIRTRDSLVRVRSTLVTHVRGAVKSFGARLLQCSTEAFVNRNRELVPEPLRPALDPVFAQIDALTWTIDEYDKRIAELVATRYPEVERVTQIKGVGLLTGLAFVLVLEDATKFKSSRAVGAYLGLTSARDQSGQSDPQRSITKAGDHLLRKLLVQSAQYILGHFGEPCDLRRHGEKIAARGGARAKKRATIAVARKLSVLMHRLWVTGDTYDRHRNARALEAAA